MSESSIWICLLTVTVLLRGVAADTTTVNYAFEYDFSKIISKKTEFLTGCSDQIKPVACEDVKAVAPYTVLTVKGSELEVNALMQNMNKNGLVVDGFDALPKGEQLNPGVINSYSFEVNYTSVVGTKKTDFLAECSTFFSPAKCLDVTNFEGISATIKISGDSLQMKKVTTKVGEAAGVKFPSFETLGKGTLVVPTVSQDLSFEFDFAKVELKKEDFLKEFEAACTGVTVKDAKKVALLTEVHIVGPKEALDAAVAKIETDGIDLPTFGPLGAGTVVATTTKGPQLPTEEVSFDMDYDTIIGLKTERFLVECSEKIKPLKCTKVRKGSVIVTITGERAKLDTQITAMKTTGFTLPTFGNFGVGKVIEPIQEFDVKFNKDFKEVVEGRKAALINECNQKYKIYEVKCIDMISGSIIIRLQGARDKIKTVSDKMVAEGVTLGSVPFGNGVKVGVVATGGSGLALPESPYISTEAPEDDSSDDSDEPSDMTTLEASNPPSLSPTASTIHPDFEAVDLKRWSYPAKNDEWGGLCKQGDRQSPIDLPALSAAQRQYPLVDYMQYREVAMIGVDSGVGLKWNPKRGEPALGYLTLADTEYSLMYWTIHTPSEHTSDGKDFDMEIQFYHKSEAGKLLVLGVLCSVMPLTPSSKFWEQLQAAMSEPAEVDPRGLFLDPDYDTQRWFQYDGSLTTPPCDQEVQWVILGQQCSIPHNFYTYATSFKSMLENRRPPQPLGGRMIRAKSDVFSSEWHYPASNSEWGGMCLRGKEQSPIDFDLDVMTGMKPQPKLLDMVTGKTVNFKGTDTKRMLKWVVTGTGAGMTYKKRFWELKEFQLHTKSEHTIAGGQYDLEIVFVHENDKGEILNVAILCKGENFGQADFFTNLRESFTPAKRSKGFNMDPKAVIFQALGDTTEYMRYRGSLTMPPCTEGVEWIVMASLMKVPRDFLIWLLNFKSMKYNFRPTQPLNDRVVYVNDAPVLASPESSALSTIQTVQLISGVGLLVLGLFLIADCRIFRKKTEEARQPLISHVSLP